MVAGLLVVVLPIFSAPAQVYPSAPQSATSSDGVDAAGMIKVLSTAHGGVGGFLDVPGYTSCRYVTDGLPAGNDEMIPVDSLTDWAAWVADPGHGDSQTVCCRPQAVTLCKTGGARTQSFTLPYSILGQIQTPTAECTDGGYVNYKDSQPWTCGQGVGASGLADGAWSQKQADSYTCSPNAFTSGCSASCPQTVGTTTTYDSCGNVQAVNSCSISCCTPSYSKSCSASTAIYTDDKCGTGSYSVSGGCTYTEWGSGHCGCFYHGPVTNGSSEFYDCGGNGAGSSWSFSGNQSNCTVSGPDCIDSQPGPNHGDDAGGTNEACYGYE